MSLSFASTQRYIVNCQKHVEAPAYLRNRLRGRVTFDLTPIMRKGSNSGSTGRYYVRLGNKLVFIKVH